MERPGGVERVSSAEIFLTRREAFPPCLSVWCGGCYQTAAQDPFPIQTQLEDEENEDLVTEKDDTRRFRQGRDGDHLMGIPFECDLCSFRNVAQRNPMWKNKKDNYTLICIRRANLDAMWSREASTVETNVRRINLDYLLGSQLLSVDQP